MPRCALQWRTRRSRSPWPQATSSREKARRLAVSRASQASIGRCVRVTTIDPRQVGEAAGVVVVSRRSRYPSARRRCCARRGSWAVEGEGFHGQAGAEGHRHALAGAGGVAQDALQARKSAWRTTCCRSRAARRGRIAARRGAAPAPAAPQSRIERPPACTAHSAMSFAVRSRSSAGPCSGSQRRMRPGTWPDRCMTKP